jgi:hypothetical protein
MQVKIFKICFICGICIFFTSPLLAFYSASQDTAKKDTAQVKPDYENVNVSVTTDWGVSDKHENVDVRLVWTGKKVTEVVVLKKHSECSVKPMEGVVITISDSKSGKVLKRFK